jgi:signal transduction histidine kinase
MRAPTAVARLLLLVSALVADIVPATATGPVHAAGAPPCQPCAFLVLDADDTNRPGFQEALAGLREVLSEPHGPPGNLYVENLDLARFTQPEHEAQVTDWLLRKYQGRRIDAIISVTPVPLGIASWLRERAWPTAAIVSLGTMPEGGSAPPGRGILVTDLDVPGTVRAAMRLFPCPRRIEVIGGPHYGDAAGAEILAEAAEVPDLDVRFAPAMSLPDLHRHVAAAAPDTVFLFITVYRDSAGAVTVPRDVLASLSRVSARPIFAFSTTYVGHGMIGGDLLDLRAMGRGLGRLATEAIARGTSAPGPVARLGSSLVLDYRELTRWHVRDRQVPPQAQVLFRPPDLWEQYRDAVAATLVVLALQAAWITWLLIERRQRRRVERQLTDLSGRMLASQEGERGRIARDLHDDVNQRVALAAIELDGIAVDAATPADTGSRVSAVADELRALGLDVHALAHQLRPAELDYVGLPTALRSLAETITARAGIAIDVVEAGWPKAVPEEAALVCYRVAQEALQNVRKHSGARSCRVAVGLREGMLFLRVSDDGRGFESGQRASSRQLGIAGMHERLRLVGGTLSVRSAPDQGTELEALIPRPAAAAGGAVA